jgi:ATP-dependent protease ClpP protease subunit
LKNNQEFLSISSVQVSPIANHYTLQINKELEHREDWLDELEVLYNCHENDQVLIRINCGGGDAMILNQWLSAMNQCKARITGEITGMCASAATFIFLACDEHIINHGIEFMAHTCQGSVGWGNERNIQERAAFLRRSTQSLMDTHYKYFFTEDEISKILEGSEIYLDYDEVANRLATRHEALVELYDGDDKPLDRKQLETMTKEQILDTLFGEEGVPTEIAGEVDVDDYYDIDEERIVNTKDKLYLTKIADEFGLKYAHNIGIGNLRKKLIEHLGI